jgi:hypothetical protein
LDIRPKGLKEELAEKVAVIQKMEIQMEILRELIKK